MIEKFCHCPTCGQSGLKMDLHNSVVCSGCGFTYFFNCASAVAGLVVNDDGRLLVTVRPEHQVRFEELFAGQAFACIGSVTRDPILQVTGLNGEILVRSTNDELKQAWQSPLREL
jgi:hypothetical protein